MLRRTGLLVVVTVALLTSLSTQGSAGSPERSATADATGVRTFAYHVNGKRAGWVRREGPRSWWASDGGNSAIHADRKGGYGITEGFHTYAYAWPARPGERSRYVVWEGRGRPTRTSDTFERVSATRWNVLRGGRLTGFTRGPDGVAAALGYYMWGDELLPD
jgi:hypothetical protein